MGWKLPPYSVEQVLVAQSQVVDWGVRALGVPELWRKTRGKGVRVAVLDTGAPDHPDLAGAVLEARDFTGSRYGSRDVQGHSTHCCGILAARDNATGVVGVAPEASLLIAKVLGDGGSGSSAAVAAGVRWAAERGADVISMSLGSQAPDESIRSAIRDAVGRNVVVVVAAGNDGPDPGSVDYPGRWPEAVAVASYNEAGRISDFSSRGAEVDVAAPGEHITSTYLNGTLAKLSGTSMATPFAAGVIALLLAARAPAKLSAAEVLSRIKETSADIGSPGFDPASGWGLIDPKKLVIDAPAATPTLPVTHTLTFSGSFTLDGKVYG